MRVSKYYQIIGFLAVLSAVTAKAAGHAGWSTSVATRAAAVPVSTVLALLTLLSAIAIALVFRSSDDRERIPLRKNRLAGLLVYSSLALFLVPAGLNAQSVRTPVNLGTAGNYVILSESGITDVGPSPVTGNIGTSPITGAAIHVTCPEVTGTISAVDAAGPAPCTIIDPDGLGVAIGDMNTAYTDAAGRTIPDFTDLYAGNLSGKNLLPGLYKWTTGVSVDNTGVTLTGGPNAVWIFQIAGDILLASNAHVTLAGGARANNIFWQTAGPTSATLGTGSVFYGNILAAKQVIINSGSSLNGRAFAQTQVTLQTTTTTTPGPLVNGIPIPVAPTVSSTVPANGATGVPVGNALSATFSEAMDPTTINGATFTLKNGINTVAGVVTYVGVTATFTPTANLLAGTLYTATITTGAKDPAGVALASSYVWSFTTGGVVDTTPPTVSSTVPVNGAVNVPVGNALSATFSEAMNPATINNVSFNLKQGVTPVPAVVTYAGVTATLTPVGSLAPNLPFTATITTAATDLAGNALATNYVWTFTTGATPDTTPPTVSSTVPVSGAINVPVGNALSVTFSEAMNPLTISTATFSLKQGVTNVAGTVTYAGVTATFTPTGNLAANLPFTATVTTGVTDLAGNAMAGNYVWSFTTGAAPDTTPPTVSSTVPVSGGTYVPVGNALSATFSEALNPLTINTASFLLKQAGITVPGTVGYSGVTATFTPLVALTANVTYTATITTGVTDLAGNALAANYVWSFSTDTVVAPPPPVTPTVTSNVPSNGSVNVGVGNALSAAFSEPVNPLTINSATFLLYQAGNPVAGTVGYSGITATFTPLAKLAPNAVFTATLTTGVRDLAGTPLAFNYSWSFTTGATPDTTPPTVISTLPSAGALFVTLTSNVTATFSEPMNPLTITTTNFTLKQGTTTVPGTVTYSGNTATFRPVNNLAANTQYTAQIGNTATDLAGNFLTSSYQWTFTTGVAGNQTPVCLSNFAVLAGSSIISSGNTIITGDIGVSPGTVVTGFPPATLTGATHAGDAAAAQGMADFAAGYADAVGRSTGPVAVSGDLGGLTLTAGIYKSVSSLQISSGDLTLDAKGNINAVFIFQMASALTTASGRSIVLAGGAQAFNVFWQVGTSATVGANTTFNGSILADQSITMGTGATLNGRMSARTGTITLQSNTITSPAPSIAAGGIYNAASWSQTSAAGSIVAVFGNNLSSSLNVDNSNPLLTTLGGSSFKVGTVAAPLFMTSCSQVNLQIPWEAVGQTQLPVTGTAGGQVSLQQPVTLAPFAPGIFSLNQFGSGQGAVEIAPTAVVAGPLGTGSRPVKRGEYIAIFTTGLGPVSNQPPTGTAGSSSPLSLTPTLPVVTVGNATALVTYSGLAPTLTGVYQVNAIVPDAALTGDSVNLVISIGGITSNTVTIAVQ